MMSLLLAQDYGNSVELIQLYMQNNVKKGYIVHGSFLPPWLTLVTRKLLKSITTAYTFSFAFQFSFLLEAEGQKANTQMHKQSNNGLDAPTSRGSEGNPSDASHLTCNLYMWIHSYRSQLFYIFTSLECGHETKKRVSQGWSLQVFGIKYAINDFLCMVFSVTYYLELCNVITLSIGLHCYQQRLNRLFGHYRTYTKLTLLG